LDRHLRELADRLIRPFIEDEPLGLVGSGDELPIQIIANAE
jgi:hypothetical protein